MDKYEYNLKLEEINRLVENENYEDAAQIADTIDWRRVRNARTLCMISEIYEANGRLEDSKAILLRAYRRSQLGRIVLYRLTEVAIKMREFDEAVEYYSEFVNAAPNDNSRFVLKYKIYRGRGSSLEDQIAILEEYKQKEYTEKWAYELAKLYYKAGLIQKCVEECDDLVLWFRQGKYVIKALELKSSMSPLTPVQQAIYDHKDEHMPSKSELVDAAVPEIEKVILEKMPSSEEEAITDHIITETQRELAQAVTQHAAEAEAKREDQDEDWRFHPGTNPSMSGKIGLGDTQVFGSEGQAQPVAPQMTNIPNSAPSFNTEDLQKELANSMREIVAGMTVKESDDDIIEPMNDKPFLDDESYDDSVNTDSTILKEEELPGQLSIDDILTTMAAETAAGQNTNTVPSEAQAADQSVDNGQNVAANSTAADTVQEQSIPAGASETPVQSAVAGADLAPVQGVPAGAAVSSAQGTPAGADVTSTQGASVGAAVPQAQGVPAGAAVPPFQGASVGAAVPQAQGVPAGAAVPPFQGVPAGAAVPSAQGVPAGAAVPPFQGVPAGAAVPPVQGVPAGAAVPPVQGASVGTPVPQAQGVSSDVGVEPPLATTAGMNAASGAVQSGSAAVTGDTIDLSAALERAAGVSDMKPRNQQPAPQPVPPLEPEPPVAPKLTQDEQYIFSYFSSIAGLREQIAMALSEAKKKVKMDKTSRSGNIVVTGDPGSGRTTLGIRFAKVLSKSKGETSARIAKIYAEDFNNKDIPSTIAKIAGGTLIIEEAADLKDEIVKQMTTAMEFRTDGLVIILEDEKKLLKGLFERHPEFAEKFTSEVNIPIFTNDELVSFGKTYAFDEDYKIDNMATLALYNRIGELQTPEHPVTVTDVKEIIDKAIRHSERFGFRKLGMILSKKRYDEDDRIILYEKDFKM